MPNFFGLQNLRGRASGFVSGISGFRVYRFWFRVRCLRFGYVLGVRLCFGLPRVLGDEEFRV